MADSMVVRSQRACVLLQALLWQTTVAFREGQDDAQAGFACPDGFKCLPAPCTVPNSNGLKGLDCACKDGFEGEIKWYGGFANGKCEPSKCDIPNSNRLPGPECACLDGFTGEIKWLPGGKMVGSCVPAACQANRTNGLPGLECGCDKFSVGQVKWQGDVPTAECEDQTTDAAPLFDKESLLYVDGKVFKCCTGTLDGVKLGPAIWDITSDDLPSARSFGRRTGCGRIMGDHWHSFRHNKVWQSCPVKLDDLSKTTGVARETLVGWLAAKGEAVGGGGRK